MIVGAQVAGVGASDMISELSLAVESGMNTEDIALTIHPHPSLGEIVMDTELALDTNSYLKSKGKFEETQSDGWASFVFIDFHFVIIESKVGDYAIFEIISHLSLVCFSFAFMYVALIYLICRKTKLVKAGIIYGIVTKYLYRVIIIFL